MFDKVIDWFWNEILGKMIVVFWREVDNADYFKDDKQDHDEGSDNDEYDYLRVIMMPLKT